MNPLPQRTIRDSVGDAWDEPDTGKPPCDFCRRTALCECMTWTRIGPFYITNPERCMCTCGRCME